MYTYRIVFGWDDEPILIVLKDMEEVCRATIGNEEGRIYANSFHNVIDMLLYSLNNDGKFIHDEILS